MTHDELLKLILDSEIRSNEVGQGGWQALRAVVELHKPNQDNDCMRCIAQYDMDDIGNIAYPCQTIKAIEKELK